MIYQLKENKLKKELKQHVSLLFLYVYTRFF